MGSPEKLTTTLKKSFKIYLVILIVLMFEMSLNRKPIKRDSKT